MILKLYIEREVENEEQAKNIGINLGIFGFDILSSDVSELTNKQMQQKIEALELVECALRTKIAQLESTTE